MKKMSAAKPPEPTPTKSSTGKVPKDEKFMVWGSRVTELEKEYADLTVRTRNGFAERLIRRGEVISAEALETVVAVSIQEKEETILRAVRGYVEEDQTYPVPAKYLGRALKDMDAAKEPRKAKNRIAIMAFFHTGLARAIIRARKGNERDYRKTAKECFEHLKGAIETNTESNNASKGLEKPIRILEKLNLAAPGLVKKTGNKDGKEKERRDGTYLRAFGCFVFDGWPLWPDEPPIAPTP